VAVNVQKFSDVVIDMTDIHGRKVYSMKLKDLDKGVHIVDIDRTRVDGNQIQGGIFFLSVTNGGQIQHSKVIIR
jgi:flagellar hook assembly protein FlgD